MASDFEHIFDVARLERRWIVQPAAQAAPARAPAAPQQALEVLRQLEAEIDRELGPRRKSVRPALDQVRALLGALYPETGACALTVAEMAEHAGLLGAGLDRLEDLLEALCLQRGARR